MSQKLKTRPANEDVGTGKEDWLPRKPFFRVDEVAKYFDVSDGTIKNWIAHGHFPGTIKVDRPYRIPREAILACKFKYMIRP